MVQNDWQKWQLGNALEITCVSARPGTDFRRITHLGGNLPDGSMWFTTVDAVIEGIQAGVRYYVRTGAEAQLVAVARDENGAICLAVGLGGDWEPLLRLPRCPA
jgi:hypothetical protein